MQSELMRTMWDIPTWIHRSSMEQADNNHGRSRLNVSVPLARLLWSVRLWVRNRTSISQKFGIIVEGIKTRRSTSEPIIILSSREAEIQHTWHTPHSLVIWLHNLFLIAFQMVVSGILGVVFNCSIIWMLRTRNYSVCVTASRFCI